MCMYMFGGGSRVHPTEKNCVNKLASRYSCAFSGSVSLFLWVWKESLGYIEIKKFPGLGCYGCVLFKSYTAHLGTSGWKRKVCAVGNKKASQTWLVAVI